MTAPTHEEMVAALRKAISDREAELWPGDYSHLEALRSALRTLEAAQWRPIEEAPARLQDQVRYIKGSAGEYRIRLCQYFDFVTGEHRSYAVELSGDGYTVGRFLGPLPEPPSDGRDAPAQHIRPRVEQPSDA